MDQQQDSADNLPVVVYTPDSRLRQPKVLLQEIWTDLQVSKELAWQLFQRHLGTRYRQTALGPLWVLITPIFTALVVTVIRGKGIGDIPEGEILPVPIKVFFATIIWGFFAKSVRLPLQAMSESLAILKTMRVAVEGFLMAKVGEILFEQSFQFFVFGVVLLLLPLHQNISDIPLSLSGSLLAVGLLAIMMVFGIGLGFFIVPIGSLYLDVDRALPMILQLWFFLTPEIYGPPITEESRYFFLLSLNPVAPLVKGVMDASLGAPVENGLSIVIVALLALGLFALGWLVYRVSIPLLVER